MTSRLDELREGLPRASSVAGPSAAADVEAGLDPESERLMARFSREAEAISNVLRWARDAVADVDAVFAAGPVSDSQLSASGAKLDAVEEKMAAVRKRLKRMADENKEFRRTHAHRTAVVRARVVQYKQMGEKFIDVTKDMELARGKHRDALEANNRRDILRANPGLTAAEADAALADGDRGVDSLMYSHADADTAELRHQVEDIRARNKEIEKLTKSMAELNAMFVDMSILVDGQQELINNVEYNVEEVKDSTKAAQEELVIARRHQKARNKKKCWCMIITVLIIVVVAAAILIPLAKRFGWFSGSNKNNSNNNNNNSSNNGGNSGSNNNNNNNNNGNAGNNNGGNANTGATGTNNGAGNSGNNNPGSTGNSGNTGSAGNNGGRQQQENTAGGQSRLFVSGSTHMYDVVPERDVLASTKSTHRFRVEFPVLHHLRRR